MMRLSRRRFFTLSASGLLLPAGLLARAGAAAAERRFLFIFCEGGWDQTKVFAPTFDSEEIPDESGAEPASVGGLTFVDHPDRPSVRSFFEGYADRTCLINGFEVPSIAHDRCRQLVMTAGTSEEADDWAAILAGNARGGPLLPQVLVSGPSFSARYTPQVIRIGSQGQISGLIDGTALSSSDRPVLLPEAGAEALLDDYVKARVAAEQARVGAGQAATFLERYGAALSDLTELRGLAGEFDLQVDESAEFSEQLSPVLDLLEAGLSRTAMIRFLGMKNEGFDSHSNVDRQSDHFELLFSTLSGLMSELAGRAGPGGGTLAEELVVVVLSEMGRTPQINGQGGRDHWTYTSAMLVGPGVRGGTTIGGYDEYGLGVPADLESGQPDEAGELLTAAHFGATLLALGGVDPAEHLPESSPIPAALL